MAEFIEHNLQGVDSAILAVPVALAKGIGWEDLARMVKDEKKAGNPIAGLIDKLHFEKNCMALLIAIISMKWMMMKTLLPLYHTCIRFTGLRNLTGSSALGTIWLLAGVMLSKMR
ncbi:hypothetical protein Peur_017853 [Populus x canadensis]